MLLMTRTERLRVDVTASHTGGGRGRRYIKVTMFPAARGDCLLVEFGKTGDSHRILIDGGPASTYDATLHRWLEDQPRSARSLDLLVVTHVDADHMDGAMLLLQEAESSTLVLGDVWFNDWGHLQEDGIVNETFEPLRGKFLGRLLENSKVPWNQAFRGGAVVVPEEGQLPTASFFEGAKVTLLAPQRRQLRRLRRNWGTVISDAGWHPGAEPRSARRLEQREDYLPTARADDFGAQELRSDNPIANGSSIAFVLEYQKMRCLFTGDAPAPVLKEGLARFAQERKFDRIPVDLVKLPDHGSSAGVDEELLQLLDGPRFLVSTNGDYGHPDTEALKLVIQQADPDRPLELWFNYRNQRTRARRTGESIAPRPKLRCSSSGDGRGVTVQVRRGAS